jgi:L-fuconolactonase
MLQDLADTDWILQDALAPALEAMSDLGLVFDALVQPRHLDRMATLLARHPRLRVVIDHGAKPVPGEEEPWLAGLRRVAEAGSAERLACKLSGLWTEWPGAADCQTLEPWCHALFSLWGAERLIWGSDWPVLELAGDYRRWRAGSLQFLQQRCSAAQLQAVLEGNARRMYRL